ncbi:MAG: CDP-diacylglycerol--serine O-phosphatidyltransferase [Nitrospinota bacterium]
MAKAKSNINGLGRTGIFIAPSLITAVSFFCGFYAVIKSIQGDFYVAGWAIVIGVVLDGLDGRVARLFGSSSQFGVEFDSLSDLVVFGVAPSILIYNWLLAPYGKVGWMAAFLFTLCGALRLARFNSVARSVTNPAKKERFIGLPIPAAAGLIASLSLIMNGYFEISNLQSIFPLIGTYVLALLMVSGIPYRSFKNLKLRTRYSFQTILAVILVAFLFALKPHIFLFIFGICYHLSGPCEWIYETRNFDSKKRLRSLLGLTVE